MWQEVQNLKISARDKTVNGTCEYDGLKNPQKYFQNLGEKIFLFKNIFRPQNFEKPLFLAIFVQKFIELARETRRLKVHMSMMAQKNRNKKL